MSSQGSSTNLDEMDFLKLLGQLVKGIYYLVSTIH